jgi:hypothetical protein
MKEHLIYRVEENLKKHEILYNIVVLANLSEELISSLIYSFPYKKHWNDFQREGKSVKAGLKV